MEFDHIFSPVQAGKDSRYFIGSAARHFVTRLLVRKKTAAWMNHQKVKFHVLKQ